MIRQAALLLLVVCASGVQAAGPSAVPAGGTYTVPVSVTITKGADAELSEVYYTLDGRQPSYMEGEYDGFVVNSGTITISSSCTLKLFQWGMGYSPEYATYSFTINAAPPPAPPAPVITPGSVTYNGSLPFTVSIAPAPGHTATLIQYALGATPPGEQGWSTYSGPVAVNSYGTLTVNARYVEGGVTSDSAAKEFKIHSPVPTPIIAPASGSYPGTQQISVAVPPGGSSNYRVDYQLQGDVQTGYSPYGGSFALPGDVTVYSRIVDLNTGAESATVSSVYTYIPPPAAPVITPATGGTITPSTQITISIGSDADGVWYTTDGSEPTVGHGTYSAGGAVINPSTGVPHVRAIAVGPGGTSAVVDATWNLTCDITWTITPSKPANADGSYPTDTVWTLIAVGWEGCYEAKDLIYGWTIDGEDHFSFRTPVTPSGAQIVGNSASGWLQGSHSIGASVMTVDGAGGELVSWSGYQTFTAGATSEPPHCCNCCCAACQNPDQWTQPDQMVQTNRPDAQPYVEDPDSQLTVPGVPSAATGWFRNPVLPWQGDAPFVLVWDLSSLPYLPFTYTFRSDDVMNSLGGYLGLYDLLWAIRVPMRTILMWGILVWFCWSSLNTLWRLVE